MAQLATSTQAAAFPTEAAIIAKIIIIDSYWEVIIIEITILESLICLVKPAIVGDLVCQYSAKVIIMEHPLEAMIMLMGVRAIFIAAMGPAWEAYYLYRTKLHFIFNLI